MRIGPYPRGPGGIRPVSLGLWLAAAVVGLLQVAAALSRPVHDRLADLHVYVGSARLLLDGGSLYDFAAHNGAPFTYPPFAGMLFTPLAVVPEAPLRLVWTALTVAAVVVLAMLAKRADGVRGLPPDVSVPLIALLLLLAAPTSSNIRFGQISVLLVVLVLLDCLGVLPARFRGVATGVAAAVKLTPMIFVPYWWFSGQRRTAATAVAAFIGCTALAWLVLPGESIRFWLTEIWNVDRVGNIATGGNQSLNGALLRWDLPDSARTLLIGTVGLAIVAVTLLRAVRAYRNADPFAAAVLVGAAGLVFSPVSWTHHQFWLLLAALVAVSERPWINAVWLAVVCAVMILPVTSVGASLPGGMLTGNLRLFLAVAVACVVPFRAVRGGRSPSTVVATSAGTPHRIP